MAFVLQNRTQETTTTTGTGTITLAGAVAGFQSFATVGNGNTTYYCITSGSAWEVGLGTYSSAGPTLARTTIYSNSLGTTAAISLTGTSNVFVTLPAEQILGNGKFLQWQSVQTSNFTAVSGYAYPVNTTSGAITVTLPASPNIGDVVQLTDYAGTFATNNLTISPNGSKIDGSSSSVQIITNRQSIALVYIDATQGWIPYSGFNTSTPGYTYSASYLIVAGGGGGGYWDGGGGGAGGVVSGTTTFTSNNTYSVTVGAGGSGATSGGIGTNGGNSTVTGLTAAVGGGFGGSNGIAGTIGAGGSGGGGYGAATTTGGSGTSGQGSAGGNGQPLAGGGPSYGAGGGGGFGAVGGNGTSAVGGAGGVGVVTTLITTTQATSASVGQVVSTSVYFAGGGGGGINDTTGTAGAGGSGGGGAGSKSGVVPTAGSVNSGGGGGGGGGNGGGAQQSGANGGSGCVILSVPTAYYSGTYTGSPTVVTNGSNTVLIFKSSTGSYTA